MKNLIALLLAWFAFGVAATAIFGHLIGQLKLASWFDGMVPMAVSTATAIMSLAISLFLHLSHRREHKL